MWKTVFTFRLEGAERVLEPMKARALEDGKPGLES